MVLNELSMPTKGASTAAPNSTFAGSHNVAGLIFNVFFSTFDAGTGWYWCKVNDGMCEVPFGPYPEAQGAYLAAIAD
jgi:hypothetical protein